jgi:hypothetical protein
MVDFKRVGANGSRAGGVGNTDIAGGVGYDLSHSIEGFPSGV